LLILIEDNIIFLDIPKHSLEDSARNGEIYILPFQSEKSVLQPFHLGFHSLAFFGVFLPISLLITSSKVSLGWFFRAIKSSFVSLWRTTGNCSRLVFFSLAILGLIVVNWV